MSEPRYYVDRMNSTFVILDRTKDGGRASWGGYRVAPYMTYESAQGAADAMNLTASQPLPQGDELVLAQRLGYQRNPDIPWHEYTDEERMFFRDRAQLKLRLQTLTKLYGDASERAGLITERGTSEELRAALVEKEQAWQRFVKELEKQV